MAKQDERFFEAPSFQAITIGVPFCVFKLLFGLMCSRAGTETGNAGLVALGWLIAVWAAADLLMNLLRVAFQLVGRISPIEYCTIAQIGRHFNSPRFFLAIDTFLSFSIICLALWSGWIGYLTHTESYLWYAATTLNLISLSMVSLWLEYRRRSTSKDCKRPPW